jgi:hypothetical protein
VPPALVALRGMSLSFTKTRMHGKCQGRRGTFRTEAVVAPRVPLNESDAPASEEVAVLGGAAIVPGHRGSFPGDEMLGERRRR